jgi:hypothetical protein
MGVGLSAAIAANRRWFDPVTQPTPKAKPLTQGAMHQQRRVFREVAKSVARSGIWAGPTGRVRSSGSTTPLR